MRTHRANPVHFCVGGARERSISLPIELPLKGLSSGLPLLVVFYRYNKDSMKGEGGQSQLHYLDVGGWVVVWRATLWRGYIPLSRREEGREDGGPWTIPDILGGR